MWSTVSPARQKSFLHEKKIYVGQQNAQMWGKLPFPTPASVNCLRTVKPTINRLITNQRSSRCAGTAVIPIGHRVFVDVVLDSGFVARYIYYNKNQDDYFFFK